MQIAETPSQGIRTMLAAALDALLEDIAARPERRAQLCDNFLDTLQGTVQLSVALTMRQYERPKHGKN